MARPIRLCGGGGGTFLGRFSSAINDFRSKDCGKPVRRAASGTRIRWAEGDVRDMARPGASARSPPEAIVSFVVMLLATA